jgi:putative adhesion protein
MEADMNYFTLNKHSRASRFNMIKHKRSLHQPESFPAPLKRKNFNTMRIKFPLLLLLIPFFWGCKHEKLDNKPLISVSIEPLRNIVEHLAGDYYKVVTLTPVGASPETYEPTPKQLMDVSNSKLYFAIGTLGFEKQQLERMKETAPTLKIYTVSDGISLLSVQHEGHGDSTDPHIWMSPKNVVQMARNVCNALCQNDPEHTAVYKKKLADLERHADEVDRRIRLMVSKVRYRNFLIYHPALAYFANEYGFRQLTIEQDGKEPSSEHLATIISEAKAAEVHIIFLQREFKGRSVKSFSEATGARVVIINPLAYRWDNEVIATAKALAAQ